MKNILTSYTSNDLRCHRKRQSKPILFLSVFASLLILLFLLLYPAKASARELAHYASESKLSTGKWAKIRVSDMGMQFISNATLSKLGFKNPKAVRVYGYGGRQLNETLTAADPDDLPIAASFTTDKGIYFFGYDDIRWNATPRSIVMAYNHVKNTYSKESWYYITDSTPDAVSAPEKATPATSTTRELTSFMQPIVHEVDLIHPSTTGARYLGEDFRSPSSRTFNCALTDAVANEDCFVNVAFASNTSSRSTLSIKVTGKNNKVSEAETYIGATTGSESFMTYTSTPRNVGPMGESLRVDLSFQGGGTIKMARLDYIEVNYKRHLKLSNGELHFYLNESSPAVVKIDGADSSTIVWDITNGEHPTTVASTLSGTTLSFNYSGGEREYVAFTPDKCGAAISEYANVSNQNIHALPTPDMLIIAPANLHNAANRLAQHHRDFDNLIVHVLTPENIYNEFSSGSPDPTAFRKLLKMWYDRGRLSAALSDSEEEAGTASEGNIRYCLIFGRATFDHKRLNEGMRNATWPVVPIWQSATGESQTSSYCCEDYIGMLQDCSTFSMGSAKLNVAVGRFPVMSVAEAGVMVDKYINYVTSPDLGFWRNQAMLIADDQNKGDHLTQSEDMMKGFSKSEAGSKLRFEKIYLDSFTLENGSTGHTYPQAKEKMLRLWNDGVFYINYIGHANPASWTHENLLNWTDINSFTNKNLPFLYAATCEFGRIDADSRSGAEVLWAYPEGGIIATLTPSRSVFIDANGRLSNEISKLMFKTDAEGKTQRIGDIMITAKNNYPAASNDNKLRYNLIGNPAMRLPMPELNVVVDKMANEEVDPDVSQADYPVIPARSLMRLSGHIENLNGTEAEDFSGVLDIVLYDAEKTVETNGNGNDGVVSYYNDRRTLLYRGKTKIENGKWATAVLLPSDIENNYSPAQFLFYASSNDAREANGEFSKFYVYGYDDTQEPDTRIPAIEYFTLNSRDFKSGDRVHSSPVVMARISDQSGVNISAAGIGHQMTLTLDDKKVFTDVNYYFTPDVENYTAGEILYPLTDLAPGRHTLKFSVWDNALNSSTKTIDFEVAVSKAPEIFSLSTDANPARDHVNFTLSTDMPMANVDCMIEVFDLNGRRVWTSQQNVKIDISAGIRVPWNLCDASGVRVPRGIYVYRATVTTPQGPTATKSYKLAVAAP